MAYIEKRAHPSGNITYRVRIRVNGSPSISESFPTRRAAKDMILVSLDVDSAGAIAYQWWKKVYPRVKLWLTPVGKSLGEANERGVELKEWISLAFSNNQL